MDRWLFVFTVAIGFVIFWFLPWPVKRMGKTIERLGGWGWGVGVVMRLLGKLIHLLGRFMQWCEYPTKGWITLTFLISLMLAVRDTTNYSQGVIYWLCSQDSRSNITSQQHLSFAFRNMGWLVALAYWFLIVSIVLVVTSLARGARKSRGVDDNESIVNKLDEIQKEMRKGFTDMRPKGDEHDRPD